jgi:hypothetical protein
MCLFGFVEDDVDGEDAFEDPYLRIRPRERRWHPQISCLLVPGLPRGALVEIQPLACCAEDLQTVESASDSEDAGETSSQK